MSGWPVTKFSFCGSTFTGLESAVSGEIFCWAMGRLKPLHDLGKMYETKWGGMRGGLTCLPRLLWLTSDQHPVGLWTHNSGKKQLHTIMNSHQWTENTLPLKPGAIYHGEGLRADLGSGPCLHDQEPESFVKEASLRWTKPPVLIRLVCPSIYL